MMMLRLS
jgi:Ribosomal protein S5, N-terminal domain